MAYFSPSRQRARSELFDKQLATVIDLLAYPEVQQRLGVMARLLVQECEHAFLPNVRHGVARLPAEQVGTPNVAYLPLLRSDGEPGQMKINRELAAPSRHMAEIIGRATNMAVLPTFQEYYGGDTHRLRTKFNNALTFAAPVIIGERDNPRVAVGRSVVVVAPYPRTELQVGDTVCHEFQHAIDNQRTDLSTQIFSSAFEKARYHASKEFRAYRVGYFVTDALGVPEQRETAVMDSWLEFNLEQSGGWDMPDAGVQRAQLLGII